MISSQNLIPLVGGAYQARSKIANMEVCENIFPESNPPETDSPVPVTHYPREGERLLAAPPQIGPGRGIFTLSTGALAAVVGNNVYYIDNNWGWNLVGIIGTGLIEALGVIVPGAGGANGIYANVALTGGSGTGATATILVVGGAVFAVSIINPGTGYVVGDILSAAGANIGNVVGFSVPVTAIFLNLAAPRTTPVSISDNGTTAVIVDGSPYGYTVNLVTRAFAVLVDPTGTFVGATRVDYSDGFLAFNEPGTNGWYVSLINQVSFNALAIANKSGKPDPIGTLAFNIRQAWLIGTETTEIWYNAGSSPFPYQAWPNIFVPFGIAAIYSLVQADVELFWLARNMQGQAIAVGTKGYGVVAISTRALEYEWSTYQTVADCIGGTYQQGGHTFLIWHFPTADRTWAYDLATKQWHRRTWIDPNGVKHRQRSTFFASVGPDGGYVKTIVGQDFSNGQIYALDQKYYTDNGNPIVCVRSFPHVMADMKEITHASFVADFETGGMLGAPAPGPVPGSDFNADFNADFAGPAVPPVVDALPTGPVLNLRYSNDGGNKWSNYRPKPLNTGNYREMMRWRGLGMARDRIYELMWSYDGPSALQGAYLEPIEHGA